MGKSVLSNFHGAKTVWYWKRFLMYRIEAEARAIMRLVIDCLISTYRTYSSSRYLLTTFYQSSRSPSFADYIASNLSRAFIKIFSFVFIFLSPLTPVVRNTADLVDT